MKMIMTVIHLFCFAFHAVLQLRCSDIQWYKRVHAVWDLGEQRGSAQVKADSTCNYSTWPTRLTTVAQQTLLRVQFKCSTVHFTCDLSLVCITVHPMYCYSVLGTTRPVPPEHSCMTTSTTLNSQKSTTSSQCQVDVSHIHSSQVPHSPLEHAGHVRPQYMDHGACSQVRVLEMNVWALFCRVGGSGAICFPKGNFKFESLTWLEMP